MQYAIRSVLPGSNSVDEEFLVHESAEAAAQSVRARGRVVLSVHEQKPARNSPFKPATFSLFCREVRTLLLAGMTIVEAIETLSARARPGETTDGLASHILRGIHQGQALSMALNDVAGVPGVLVAAVRAGERTSSLAESLNDYLRFHTLVENLRKRVISASIYPLIVTALGVAISVFLLCVVIPSFAEMYRSLRGAPSLLTSVVISASRGLTEYRSLVLGTLAFVGVAGGWWLARGGLRVVGVALVSRLPWLRIRVRDFELAMIYQALALLLRGGYPLAEALRVASQSALSADARAALEAARFRIEHGAGVSTSMHEARLCDEVGRRLMAAAERNGSFHLAVDAVSRIHGERFELFVERTSRLVEPVLLMMVALLVGGIVVAMYLPVFDMATRVQ